jgi:hypothetical protein
MWSGIDPELQELLGFAWELTNYLDIKSPWRTAIFAVDRNKLQSTSVRVLSFDAVVPISGLMINCSYLIFSKWWIVPPRCTTEASWLRRTPDWHVAANGELCWVYGPYWRDVLQGMLDELENAHRSTDSCVLVCREICRSDQQTSDSRSASSKGMAKTMAGMGSRRCRRAPV